MSQQNLSPFHYSLNKLGSNVLNDRGALEETQLSVGAEGRTREES